MRTPRVPWRRQDGDDQADGPSSGDQRRAEPLGSLGLRLTVHVGERDSFHHRPLFTEIVHRAHRAGLAGASVFRGVEGFGATSIIHTSRLLDLADDLPVAVVIIDTEAQVRAFLPELLQVAPSALVTLEPVEIILPATDEGSASANETS